jgi:hypothetical protein
MPRSKKTNPADIESAETVQKSAESVTKTAQTVPESQVDDTPAIIEPKKLTLEQTFVWNFEDIKTSLTAHIKKYSGLVVTDDNLKSMEKTQKEIASLRTKINKFRLAVKHDMEKPYKSFEQQVNELLDLIFSVEKPIKDQLEKYENKRRERKEQIVWGIIHTTAAELGLEGKYIGQMAIDNKWLNRTTTIKEITEDVQGRICWLLDVQAKDRQAALFSEQKEKMSRLLCQSLSTEAELITPLIYEEIERQIAPLPDILAVETYIKQEVDQRKEREQRAARLAIEKAGPPGTPSVQIPDTPPQMSSAVPPVYPSVETWDVVLRLPAIDLQQSRGFQKYLADTGISYEVLSQKSNRPGEQS